MRRKINQSKPPSIDTNDKICRKEHSSCYYNCIYKLKKPDKGLTILSRDRKREIVGVGKDFLHST